MKSLK